MGARMLGCEVLFGRDRGAEVREIYERATGADCPCSQGSPCPLLPEPREPSDS